MTEHVPLFGSVGVVDAGWLAAPVLAVPVLAVPVPVAPAPFFRMNTYQNPAMAANTPKKANPFPFMSHPFQKREARNFLPLLVDLLGNEPVNLVLLLFGQARPRLAGIDSGA